MRSELPAGRHLPKDFDSVLRTVLAPIVVEIGELADTMILSMTDPALFRSRPTIGNADIKRLTMRIS